MKVIILKIEKKIMFAQAIISRILVSVLLLCCVNLAVANSNHNYDQAFHRQHGDWWLSWGIGAGFGQHIDGMGSNWSFNYQLSRHQIMSAHMGGIFNAKRFGAIDPFYGFVTTPMLINPGDGFAGDIGPMYGYVRHFSHAIFSIAAGLGYVRSRDNNFADGCRASIKNTIGVPFESQLFWSYHRRKGIGLMVYGNANSNKSYVMLALALNYGHMD